MRHPAPSLLRLMVSGALLVATASPLAAANDSLGEHVEMLTTSPDDCFDPVISPDGRWLVYTCTSGGDLDLFAQRLDRPRHDPPIAIAPSAAEDSGAAFAPGGGWLAFVSNREDAFGDVWVMRFPGGTPVLVSERGRRDRAPQWDGTTRRPRLLFESEEADGTWGLYAATPGAWSPVRVDDTERPAPAAGPHLVLQHVDDTNGDGETNLRSGDHPSIWESDPATRLFRQLTPPIDGVDRVIRDREGNLVFAARVRDSLDIVRVRQPWSVALVGTPREAADAAEELRRNYPDRPFEAVALGRQAYLLDPVSDHGRRGLLVALDVLRDNDRPEQALLTLRQASRGVDPASVFGVELAWRSEVLDVERALRDGTPRPEVERLRRQAAARLAELVQGGGIPGALRAELVIEGARQHAALGEVQAALVLIEQARGRDSVPPIWAGRLALERGRLFRSLLPEQAPEVLLGVLNDYPGDRDLQEDAAEELVLAIMGRGMTDEERILALRAFLGAGVSNPAAIAGARLAEGRLFERQGRNNEARTAWTEAASHTVAAPRIAARAAFAHAENLARAAEYEEAIGIYERVEENLRRQLFAGVPAFIAEAREGRIREFLSKGNTELRLGDAPLARRTFRQLLDREPELVEAWRGLIEAEYRMGLLDREARARYGREAPRANRDNALAQYKHGLVLTYQDRMPREARRQLESAIALDSTVPYYYQTLGFYFEAEGRRDRQNQNAAEALRNYQRALLLVDRAGRPLDHARLLVNTANASFTLGQYARAAELYGERLALALPFDDPRTEFLAHRNHGMALFRSSRPADAVDAFAQARAALEVVRQRRFPGLTEAEIDAASTELLDRKALSLMDSGNLRDAALLFDEVARRSAPNSLNEARARRNEGFSLYRLSERRDSIENERDRRRAERALLRALEILESPDFTAAPSERGGALFTFEVTIAADPMGGAEISLDRGDEIRLVRTALSRIRLRDADPRLAAGELERQLEAQPEDTEGNRSYFQTIRLVTLDQLARQYELLGEHGLAADRLVTAIGETRFVENGVEIINAGALSHLLLHLTEVVTASPDLPSQALEDLRGTWIGGQAPSGDGVEILDACMVRALSLRLPERPDYLLLRPAFRARLQLGRTLLADRMAGETGGEDGIAALVGSTHAVRAIRLAEAAMAETREAGTDAEARRLALIATGVALRHSARHETPQQQAQRRGDALAMAERWGYPGLRWWMEAQGTLSPDPAQALAAAERAAAELDALAPGSFSEFFDRPLELIRRAEGLLVADRLARGDAAGALFEAERLRAARLRLVLGSTTPSPMADDPRDARWLREAESLRASYRRSLARLRELPVGEPHQAAVLRMRETAEAWRRHLEAGRASNLPSALLLSPAPTRVSDPGAALADALALRSQPGVLLASPGGWVAWRDGVPEVLSAPSDWTRIATDRPLWFVLGDRPGEVPGAEVVHLLTFESAILAQSNLRIDTGVEAIEWPLPGTDGGLGVASLPGAEVELRRAFALAAPVRPVGRDPLLWQLSGVDASLGAVLRALPPLDSFAAEVDLRSGGAMTRESDEELLAALAAHTGSAEARIGGSAWVSRMLRPREAPEIAGAELSANIGAVQDRLGAGDLRGALEPTRRTYHLRRALGAPPGEVTEAGTLLAQIQGDLRRYREAARTMAEVVEQRREDADRLGFANALVILASYQSDARQHAAALATLEEAVRLLRDLGHEERELIATAQIGVVLENAGRYPEAILVLEEVRDRLSALGDTEGVIEQWRRIGRVYLLRQNVYPAAERAFGEALRLSVEHGLAGSAILSTLDLARVDERLGRYERAVDRARAMAAEAATLGDPLLEIDAILLEAFVEWARAGYFDAFRLVRDGLQKAEAIGDAPFRIIAHNTSGLIYWAVNDADSALTEFNRAIALAEEEGLAREVASGLNNRALVHRSLRDFERAFEDLEAARRIDEEQDNQWGVAYVLRNTGLTEIQRGAPGRAVAPLRRSVEIAGGIGDRTNRAKALLGLGEAHRHLLEKEDAIARYTEALEEARVIPLPEVEWRALHGMAVLARRDGDLARARALFEQSVRVIEELRSRIRIEEFQDGFLLDKQEVYDDLVALLLESGEVREAYNVSERSRARNFVDLLGNARVRGRTESDQRDLDRERELRSDLEAARAALGAAAEPDRESLRAAVEEIARDYTNFMIELRSRNPQLSSFVSVETLVLEQVQALLDPGTALVQYHVLPESLVAWVVTPDGVRHVRVPVPRAELDRLIRVFRADLQNFARVEEELRDLSDVVWAPVARLIDPQTERLAVVPHREMHLVPFAALLDGQGALIDRYALFHSPSASVLEYTKGRRTDRNGEAPRVLAFGNPDRNDPAMDLPFAQKEAERIAWTHPDAEIRTRGEATRSWLTENAGRFDVIHLASHGEFDPEMPLLSSIMLAPDGTGTGDLTAEDIFSLSLNADLVALSACQTGLGRLSNGDDVIGLNRSFVYAGTRQILSSLWRVDDVSTAVMIKHFYRQVDEVDRAEALRRAMLEVRQTYPHPAHWSGMVLTGDWM